MRALYESLPPGAQRLAHTALHRLPVARRVHELSREAQRLEREIEKLNRRLEKRGLRFADDTASAELVAMLDYDGTEIRLAPSAYRRRNAQTKEPFTVAWIERSLREGTIFYDVGANIGAYSLIAAKIAPAGTHVYAFEPSFANFAVLCENIVANDLDDGITPLPISLGRTTALQLFRYSGLGPGDARHSFAEAAAPEGFQSAYDQPMLAFRLDDLIAQFGLPRPHHIKLDVDGAERAVLDGAPETLAAPELQSVMLEIAPGDESAVAPLEAAGFEMVERHERPREGRCSYGLFVRR